MFESDYHGYDTRDYTKIDNRLGSNEDFANVVRTLHENGIKVVIDGVFNHVGRGFFAFQDVLANRENSGYKDWFLLTLAVIMIIMTDSGMKDGKAIIIL